VRGLHLWGDVGRGKTWLLDLFFHSLPFPDKRRWHFHRFMQSVHAELAGLKGVVDPMPQVAERLMDGARVLCLDELVVTDIGDAMLLAQLLRSLVDQGVTLVTTSNAEPDALYPDGIQRASFLPAIDLLKRHTSVLRLRGATDHRLRYLEQVPIYLTPLGPAAEARLAEEFGRLAPDAAERDGVLEVNGRAVRFRRRADLCGELHVSRDVHRQRAAGHVGFRAVRNRRQHHDFRAPLPCSFTGTLANRLDLQCVGAVRQM
jgi:cell division protein ZapE